MLCVYVKVNVLLEMMCRIKVMMMCRIKVMMKYLNLCNYRDLNYRISLIGTRTQIQCALEYKTAKAS